MTAPWPKFKEEWEFEDSEQMELIMDAVGELEISEQK